jgi:hypothetical protein
MKTGFAPATIRRGIRMQRLGKQFNPFPLVQLPYHRLVNPWTLGAVMHEVSHNLQSDLGLNKDVPRQVGLRLLKAGLGRFRLFGVGALESRDVRRHERAVAGRARGCGLVDGCDRPRAGSVFGFNPRGPHPTPYLRTAHQRGDVAPHGIWGGSGTIRASMDSHLSEPAVGTIPRKVLATFPKACALAVDAMCFRPFPSLGNKSLSQVIRFEKKDQKMIEESARRIAAGT